MWKVVVILVVIKLLSSCRHFACSLKRYDPELENLKSFASDDEENVAKAFLVEFRKAVNIQYFLHFRQTMEGRLGK